MDYTEDVPLLSSFLFASIWQICVISVFFYVGFQAERFLNYSGGVNSNPNLHKTFFFFLTSPKAQAKEGKLPYHLTVSQLFLFFGFFKEGVASMNLALCMGPFSIPCFTGTQGVTSCMHGVFIDHIKTKELLSSLLEFSLCLVFCFFSHLNFQSLGIYFSLL